MSSTRRTLLLIIALTVSLIVTVVLPLFLPTYRISGDLGGRGQFVSLPGQQTIEQPIVLASSEPNALFIALEDLQNAKSITIRFYSHDRIPVSGVLGGVPLELSLQDERVLPGVVFELPSIPEGRYLLEVGFQKSPTSFTQILADERSIGDPDALITDQGRKPLALSSTWLVSEMSWSTLTGAEQAELYVLLMTVIGVSVATMLTVGLAAYWESASTNQRKRLVVLLLLLVVVGALLGRAWTIYTWPVINDEQFYIFDAVLFDPADPHFWKTPALIVLLRLWMAVSGLSSVFQLRIIMAVISVVLVLILTETARRLAGRWAAVGTFVVGMLCPIVWPYTSLLMTEHLMIVPASTALLLAIISRDQSRPSPGKLLSISVLIGLATAARWSGIFWLLPAIVLLRTKDIREYVRRMVWVVGPYVVSFFIALVALSDVVRNWRMGEIFVEFFERSSERGWTTKLLSWRRPFTRLTPLFLLSLVATVGRSWRRELSSIALVTLFMSFVGRHLYEAAVTPDALVDWTLLFSIPILLLVIGWFSFSIYSRNQLIEVAMFGIGPVLSYIIFHKTNDKYLSELFPVLILGAGFGLGLVLESLVIASRRIFAGVFTLLFLWWFLPWVPNVFNQPYAGTLEVSAVQQAAEYLRQKSVLNETVLTASTIIPLLAGISPAYQISHPAWIDPTFRGEVDERFDLIHDPIAEDLAQDLVPWVIDEKLTTDTFRRHSGIDSLLMENFEVVAIIENGLSKPITILRIKEDQ